MLELRGVSKTYGLNGQRVTAVADVTLSVAPGEFVALTGPSGCGKSTLLHLMGAMDRADSGEIWLADQPLHDLGEEELIQVRRRQIGFVFQFFYLLPTMTVEENVELPLLLAGVTCHLERVAALLEQVGLSHRARAYPATLSGGELQRAALARALVGRPRLIIADEPTGNLDPGTSGRVFEALTLLVRGTGLAALIATHNLDLAAQMDRTLRLDAGRVMAA